MHSAKNVVWQPANPSTTTGCRALSAAMTVHKPDAICFRRARRTLELTRRRLLPTHPRQAPKKHHGQPAVVRHHEAFLAHDQASTRASSGDDTASRNGRRLTLGPTIRLASHRHSRFRRSRTICRNRRSLAGLSAGSCTLRVPVSIHARLGMWRSTSAGRRRTMPLTGSGSQRHCSSA